jgi:phosphoglycolate phosphatase-like HAD superfamily hydrolase
MIKLAVFDWNGTILADTQAVVEGVNKELEVVGHPPITVGIYRNYYDVPIVNFYKEIGIDPAVLKAKSVEVAEAFHTFYEPRVARARTRSGARKMFDTLADRGIKKVILSNHTMEGIYLQLERLKLTHYFESVLANDNKGAAYFKGKRDRLHIYLEQHKIEPSKVAIIGDTIEEVRIARDLGAKTVCITGGHNSTSRLKQAEPDAIIHKLVDLPAALEIL